MPQLENPSEFARLYLAAIERVKAQGRGRLTELGKAIGSRQRIYDPQTKPRAVGLEVVVMVAEQARLTEQESSDLVRAWLMERIESGAVGKAVVEICRGLNSIPTIVHRALTSVDAATRETILTKIHGFVNESYNKAVAAYLDAHGVSFENLGNVGNERGKRSR